MSIGSRNRSKAISDKHISSSNFYCNTNRNRITHGSFSVLAYNKLNHWSLQMQTRVAHLLCG